MNSLLKEHNIKATNQRVDILNTLINKESVTIKEIEELNKEIDPSTIYRTLSLFIDNNIIDKRIEDNQIVYEIKQKHKHYINCIKCHKKEELTNCPFDEKSMNGYMIVEHQVNIKGICKDCQKK